MKQKYTNTPVQQFVVETKSPGKNYTNTDYICPLCRTQVRKRYFGEHVDKIHALRKDEVYARLFGLAYPVRCSCGTELHYDDTKKGFPSSCGKCNGNVVMEKEYKNAEDAHDHVEQLKELLARAQAEEVRLKKEAELEKTPIEELPFPSIKYEKFMRRLSKLIRVHALNADKAKLFELANLIDKKIA